MGKKLFTSVMIGLVFVLAFVLATAPTEATQYKFNAVSYRTQVPNGFIYRMSQQFTGTGTAQSDTIIVNLPVVPPQTVTVPDTVLFYVNVFTSDSAVIGVRYQISSDNTTWKSYTIGTDSTSWYPGAYDAGTTIALHPFVISTPQYGGVQPYSRIMVVGSNPSSRALDGWVGKVKIDVIPIRQN